MSDRIVFDIPDATGTHGEVLAAAGLADLLSGVVTVPVVLMRSQASYQVQVDLNWSDSLIRELPQDPGYPFLKANEKVKVPLEVTHFVDYKAEKAKVDRLRKSGPAKGRRAKQGASTSDLTELMESDLPRSDWRLLQALNTLQGDDISNKVHHRIVASSAEKFREDVRIALERLRAGRESGLDWETSSVQIFTPTLAKGYARLKPDSTDRNDRTKEQWADPFIDWLKVRGYFGIACPFFCGSKGQDVRLLVPVPTRITWDALRQAIVDLRLEQVFGGPPKVDVLSALALAEILIRHSEEYHAPDIDPYFGIRLDGMRVDDVISSLFVTHYQSLGNARAVSSMSTVSLPGWFALRSKGDAYEMLEIIREHRAVLRPLRDDHSNEISLLIRYRRFLQKHGEEAAWAFLEFLEEYGQFWMRTFGLKEGGRERRPRRFSTRLVRRVLQGNMNRVSEILENEGFKAVAAAVRRSTVSAQAQKTMGIKDHREIRYDLLHQLRQKRQLSAEVLIETVADFIASYNAENARTREIKKNLRAAPANITDEQFASFVSLFDSVRKPSLIGAMLAAFGSCREEMEESEPEEPEPTDSGQENQG